jgi:hypothetical protein
MAPSNRTLVPLFNALNTLVIPLVKSGFANPLPIGAGLIALEISGRRTGQRRITPLTCLALGRRLIVATVRSESQWVRNLAAADSAGLWWG